MRSDKNRLPGLTIAWMLLALVGCDDKPGGDSMREPETSKNWQLPIEVREPESEGDLGGDWARAADEPTGTASRATVWAVLLDTFPGTGRRDAAANMIRNASSIDARLAGARIHETERGAMVVFGAYDGVDDPVARADLAWIKSITFREQQLFPRAMLTRLHTKMDPARLRPNELLSVRLRYPRVDPLYTFEVAVWGVFGDKRTSWDAMKRNAENQVRSLRGRGLEAYYHHDEDLQLSMVTIGLFDHTSIDVQSGIEDIDLTRLRQAFPERLVNGEPVLELIHPKQPRLGSRPQAPRLVLVPKL